MHRALDVRRVQIWVKTDMKTRESYSEVQALYKVMHLKALCVVIYLGALYMVSHSEVLYVVMHLEALTIHGLPFSWGGSNLEMC